MVATASSYNVGCKGIELLMDFDDTGVGKVGIDNRTVESCPWFFLSIRNDHCQGNRQDCVKTISNEGAQMVSVE